MKLLQAFPPRPIASEEDYQATQKVIDKLIDQGSLNPEEQDYLQCRGEDPRYTDVNGGMKPRPTNKPRSVHTSPLDILRSSP